MTFCDRVHFIPGSGAMAKKRIKRPADVLERAKLIGDIATGQVEDQQDTDIETGKRRPTNENGAIISVNATQPNNDPCLSG